MGIARRLGATAVALAMTLSLAACGRGSDGPASAGGAAESGGATRTVVDANGEQVTVPSRPSRVVTLSEPTTDNALALGVTPIGAVAGRGQDTVANYLADRAGSVAVLGSVGKPNVEAIGAAKPDLILVDGGLAQVNAAQRVVEETGADVRIAGLAKRLEEVWVPGEEFPVILPRTSPALRLLQQLRDESHRFAIAFHRRKRSKAMTRSSLDAVAGLGPAKQKALLAAFGSVAKIKRATVEDLESVRGIGPSLARAIVEHFRPGASDPGARPVA